MKKIILSCVMSALHFLLFSQLLTVVDMETGEPVSLVTVSSEDPPAYATTNMKGQVDISSFGGSGKIRFRAVGYSSVVVSFEELRKTDFSLRIPRASISLDEVVVSATRSDQKISNIPFSIFSIGPEYVSFMDTQTAADLLGASGKVFIQKSQQGGGSPMIRGFAANRLLYTGDGIRRNTAIFRSGNLQNVISLDPFATDKTEVILGPGTVIYGSDAIGGVMSFRTLKPQLSLREKRSVSGKAVTRYSSSNNERTGHFDINLGWKNFAMLSGVTYNDYGDLRMGKHGPDEYLKQAFVKRVDTADLVITNRDPLVQRPSGYSQMNLMQKMLFRPSETWEFQYGFHYSETSDYSRYDRHLLRRNGLPRYGEWNYGPQKWMMNNLGVEHKGNTMVYDRAEFRLAQQRFGESRISRDFNRSDREIRTEKVGAWSLNADFNKSQASGNKLYYGLEAIWNNVISEGITRNILTGKAVPAASRYPQSEWASYAVYAMQEFRLSEKFNLLSGLRYNFYHLKARFDTTFYHFPFTNTNLNRGAVTGSLGMVYRSAKDLIVSANLATAFRSPNVDDIGKVFDSEPGSVVVPNPDLKAEYAWSADLRLTRYFSDRISLTLNGFYTILDNAMVRRNFTLNGQDSVYYDGTRSRVQALQNAASAYVYGLHAGIELKLPNGLGFSSDLNCQKGIEELDDGSTSPLRHAAPVFGGLSLKYQKKRFRMDLYAVFNGEKTYSQLAEEERGKPEIYAVDADGNPYSPSWYTLNYKMIFRLTDHVNINAGLENITSQRYRPYSSGIAGPGRNLVISIRAEY